MVVNLTVQSGIVKSPALRYDSNSKPEFRFTLMQQEKDWPLYLPSCAVGSAAECPASEMEDGQHIIVSSGKPRYRKCTTKLGEQSRMEIFVWTVDRPTESPPDERLRSGEGGFYVRHRDRGSWWRWRRRAGEKSSPRWTPSAN